MSLEVFHLKPADYRLQPWKNGQGQTWEIARDHADPFRWRLSWANVSRSGPFSPYPGYDRSMVVLEGGPLDLSHDGKKKKRLRDLAPHVFKGEWHTDATLESPAEDFNVFALSGHAKAGVYPSFLAAKEEIQFPIAAQEHFIFCVDGKIEIRDPNSQRSFLLERRESLRLSRRDTREFLNARAIGIAPRSRCLWVVIHLVDQST
jgi:environmental stress-induced protein Ves